MIDNYLIAKFMGVDTSKLWKSMYDTDWNELMPVIDRIEALGYSVNIISKSCSIFVNREWQFRYTSDTKIEAAYNSVLSFIKWHNQQNK